jgi:hypothetical protein
VNARLQGYTVGIGGLDVHPLGFSVDFEDLRVVQEADPDPPVARIGRLSAGVHWRALLHGRLVADVALDQPWLRVNRSHIVREARDAVPVERRGWLDALQAMYPLKINEIRIRDGRLTYVDGGLARPLRLSQVTLSATNMRNIRSRDRVYPAELRADAVVFGSGRLSITGQANFLAEPYPGVLALIRLGGLQLDYFRPLLAREHVSLRGGTLSAVADIEYAPTLKAVHLHHAVVRGVEGDYVRSAAAPREPRALTPPDLQLRIDRLHVTRANFGFVDKAAERAYRVFLTDADLQLENLGSRLSDGVGTARLSGKFMGTGATLVTATVRPEPAGPDFALTVRIENTEMIAMNDLLRAYSTFDVAAGLFSCDSRLQVKNARLTGYVKPLFRHLDADGPRRDEDTGAPGGLDDGVGGRRADVLESQPREEVAAQTDLAGPVEGPKVSTWQVMVGVVQNAFFQFILPGLERQIRGRRD